MTEMKVGNMIRNLDGIERTEQKPSCKKFDVSPPKEEDRKKLNPKIKGISGSSHENFRMNSPNTIYEIGKKMDPKSQDFYTKALYSGDNPKVKLVGTGAEYWKTGEQSSGNFLTKDYPGKNAAERKENLQLPPKNDGEVVSKVKSTRPQIVIESQISPQPDWAKANGYIARPGMKQIYTPNTNPDGAMKDGRYKEVKVGTSNKE